MPVTSVHFEPAAAHDAEDLVALRIVAMRPSLERVGRFDTQRARDRFLATFTPSSTSHLIVEGRRVGFVVLRDQGDHLLLDHLYVHPEHQAKGIGATVLAAVFADADARRIPVRVGALRHSDSNRFYARHGFELIEETEWDNYYVRTPADGTVKEVGMKKEAISVTRAVVDDVADLVVILNGAIQYKVERCDMAWGNGARSEKSLRAAVAESEMYVVKLGVESVGTACLQWDDERYWGEQPPVAGYIHGLAVKAGFHGRGIGAMVVEWALRRVALRGRQFLRLDCGAGNAGLCRYYEGLGFIQVEQRVMQHDYIAALYQREARFDTRGAA